MRAGIDQTKVCVFCGGPVRYRDDDLPVRNGSVGVRVERHFMCADACADAARRRGRCGIPPQMRRRE